MEFILAVFFLLFYYLRPQDWVPGLIGLNLIKPIIMIWLAVLVINRSRSSPLPGILKTPHDWIIFMYWAYVVWTAPDSKAALTGFLSLVAFYALTVQSIASWERLQSYLKWWTMALVIVAIFGLLIPFGIDLTGGKDYMEKFQRLALGTWLHDNPNALGQSVVVAIPMGYFLFFWRGTLLGKFFIFPIIAALAFWCVYLTGSKGSFLVGGILVASIFVVGRPKLVQIVVITISLTLGMSALSFLPRMSQMSDLSSDLGVQGRIMAWEMARGVSKTHSTGVGWQQFVALINWKEENGVIVYDIPKATHSSYAQVSADLGRYGLFFYVAALWCVIHTLLKFRPANDMEDRCRRAIWILTLSTIISGWMINREYHAEYFLLIAATAALHRLAKAKEQESVLIADSESAESVSSELQSAEMIELGQADDFEIETPLSPPGVATEARADETVKKPLWNKFGVLDVGVCILLTWLVFWFWDYILKNI